MAVLYYFKRYKLCRLITKINTRFQPDAPGWCTSMDAHAGQEKAAPLSAYWGTLINVILS